MTGQGGFERWLALAMALWLVLVSAAFLFANQDYFLAKLIERGLLR